MKILEDTSENKKKPEEETQTVTITQKEHDTLLSMQDRWFKLDDRVKYWIDRVGALVSVIAADFKEYTGELIHVNFVVESIEIGGTVKKRDYLENLIIEEVRSQRFPINAIRRFDVIYDHKEQPMKVTT